MNRFRGLLIIGVLALAPPARALGPEDVFLLTNQNVRESREVALHYCDRRGVPRDHIVTLNLPTTEDISREDYNTRLVRPLRQALKDRAGQAKVLLSIYGVPLRIGPQLPTAAEKEQLANIEAELAKTTDAAEKQRLEERRRALSYAESQAAVDSELALLWWDHYDLRRWQVNPLYFQVPTALRQGKPPVLMVARLDGPSAAVARRLVDDAVAAEEHGLAGKVYVDARGISFDRGKDNSFGYGGYDESLREMAGLLEREAKLPVTLDNRPELFAPGSCPDCALYCGWYSLARYVDCCRFVPGAVAYHIASSEAVSLRQPHSTYWCKCLLEQGAAATLGPVAEPYLLGFPKPAEFFGFLATGRYTLVECYARTVPLVSWMMVLVGDPLYNPYAKAPRLTPEQVMPSPAGTRLLLQRKP